MITDEELKALADSKSEEEWNRNCDLIKKNHGGYPSDWYSKVIATGLVVKTKMKHLW